MTDVPVHQPTVIRHRGWIATGGLFGLLLLLLGFVIAIEGSTSATHALLSRGDCRAQHQGDYFKGLAVLLVEVAKPQPDHAVVVSEAQAVNDDADAYKHCSPPGDTKSLPRVRIPPRSTTTTRGG